MNRRGFLRALAATSGVALAGGCAARRTAVTPAPLYRGDRKLARVRVEPGRIIRTVVGLRPVRPLGFVVRTESFGGKTIIHNYGHGGGGVTLSWGTAQLALEEALKTGHAKYAVVGCGVVGLATARLLQRRGFDVTIYAKDLPPNTTSNIAGGLWLPTRVVDPARMTPAFADQFTRAARFAWRFFQDMVGDYYGVRWIESYLPVNERLENVFPYAGTPLHKVLSALFPPVKELSAAEHPFAFPYAYRYVTMLIEPSVYLNAVLRDFLLAGGKLVPREFANRDAVLALPEPVIVNCTGLGARALFGDEELTPGKGQLTILAPQPEVDYVVMTGGVHMFPRKDGILLGGSFEPGVWTMEPNPDVAERIWKGNTKLFGEMKT